MTSLEIAKLSWEAILRHVPELMVSIPVADGGEGTVACFHEACGGPGKSASRFRDLTDRILVKPPICSWTAAGPSLKWRPAPDCRW